MHRRIPSRLRAADTGQLSPDISPPAAASLTAVDEPDARRLLAVMITAQHGGLA
jgi:hypothetical protein